MAVLTMLDRLIRSEVPNRCVTAGLNADATSFSTRLVIDRAARVTSAGTDLRALEGRILGAWQPAWSPFWDSRGFRSQLVSGVEISEAITTGTQAEKVAFKAALRVCQYLMCRAAAGG